MKAGKSSDTAIFLPRLSMKLRAEAKVSSSVAMPRISSTSCIIGTGFMKCMPMKRSGRSVTEARRVDGDGRGVARHHRVLLQLNGREVDEDLALDRLVLGGGLDDQIGLAGEKAISEA